MPMNGCHMQALGGYVFWPMPMNGCHMQALGGYVMRAYANEWVSYAGSGRLRYEGLCQ